MNLSRESNTKDIDLAHKGNHSLILEKKSGITHENNINHNIIGISLQLTTA